jgi:hypothetical protein
MTTFYLQWEEYMSSANGVLLGKHRDSHVATLCGGMTRIEAESATDATYRWRRNFPNSRIIALSEHKEAVG